jgi:hypothetical protein
MKTVKIVQTITRARTVSSQTLADSNERDRAALARLGRRFADTLITLTRLNGEWTGEIRAP